MYDIVLCIASIIAGSLIVLIIEHFKNGNKQKFIGKLLITEDFDDGQIYISAEVESREAINNLKEGDKVIFEVEHTQK